MIKSNAYRTAHWGWWYFNYVHRLGVLKHKFTIGAQSITPSTLRMRLTGGRQYASQQHTDSDFAGLHDLCYQTILSPSGVGGIELVPTENFFECYYAACRGDNKYLQLLRKCDDFAVGLSQYLTLQVTLSKAQTEGLAYYFKMYPMIRNSMIADSFVLLRKGQ